MRSRYVNRLLVNSVTSFPCLEADVLKGFGGRPIQLGRALVVPPSSCQIAAGDPGSRTMAAGPELTEARLGAGEGCLRLVEPILLEQGAPEHELGAPDLVDVVDPTVEKLERLARLLLGQLDAAGAQVNLGKRGDRAAGVGVSSEVERDRERLLEQLHRLLGVAEQEVETTEVVRELADVNAIRKL
jgi:hypothetical protein